MIVKNTDEKNLQFHVLMSMYRKFMKIAEYETNSYIKYSDGSIEDFSEYFSKDLIYFKKEMESTIENKDDMTLIDFERKIEEVASQTFGKSTYFEHSGTYSVLNNCFNFHYISTSEIMKEYESNTYFQSEKKKEKNRFLEGILEGKNYLKESKIHECTKLEAQEIMSNHLIHYCMDYMIVKSPDYDVPLCVIIGQYALIGAYVSM